MGNKKIIFASVTATVVTILVIVFLVIFANSKDTVSFNEKWAEGINMETISVSENETENDTENDTEDEPKMWNTSRKPNAEEQYLINEAMTEVADFLGVSSSYFLDKTNVYIVDKFLLDGAEVFDLGAKTIGNNIYIKEIPGEFTMIVESAYCNYVWHECVHSYMNQVGTMNQINQSVCLVEGLAQWVASECYLIRYHDYIRPEDYKLAYANVPTYVAFTLIVKQMEIVYGKNQVLNLIKSSEEIQKFKDQNYHLYVSMCNWHDRKAINYSQQEIKKRAKEIGKMAEIKDYILSDN